MKKILLLMALCVSMFMARASTVYVDVAATGSGDGASWANAHTTINAALTAATVGDNIWVKAGVYEITAQLPIKDGVSIYGGFAGTELSIDDRAKSDLDGNGTVDPWEYSNASIIKATATFNYMIDGIVTTKTVLDGFTFTNHTGAQSAVFIRNNFELRRCIFANNNIAGASSGYTVYGVLNIMDGAIASECLLENNAVNAINKPVYGAIVALRNAGSILKNSVIRNNKAIANGQQIRGVTMYLNNGGIAYNNLIYNNSGVQGSSTAAQGAVYLDNGGGVNYFINNTVVNNFSETGNSIRINNTNAYVINSVLAESGTANTGGTGVVGLHYYNCAFSATTTHDNVKDAVVLNSL
ncbi:MAG: hypothetical protein LBH34_04175, partial [Prevotellaceae bacterium]|nr:hypothetical protein [Prevotellaceae bacterium]